MLEFSLTLPFLLLVLILNAGHRIVNTVCSCYLGHAYIGIVKHNCCYIKCRIDAEELLVTGSHVSCKTGNVSELVLDSDIFTYRSLI